jgi:hypothetical protein
MDREMNTGCTVVTMVREPVDTILNFVSWYLNLGAEKIVICFDDPEDPALGVLDAMNLDRVETHACTPEFWRALRISPKHVMKKQKAVFNWAYRNAKTPWMLALDGDEYLYLGGRSLDQFIATVDDDIPAVRFLPVEPVGTQDTVQWFRSGAHRRKLTPIYGEDIKFFGARAGLLGHSEGKSMTRTGLDVYIRLHWAKTADGTPLKNHTVGPDQGACLMHFFNNGYDEWRRKLDWRKSTWGFAKAVSAQLDSYDEPALQSLYDRIHTIDADQLAALKELNAVHNINIDLAETRSRVLGC